tara:strand:+ start:13467 stop:14255 length:789 start_codon:yes stop_codon:yes gene_type:complete
MQSLSINSIKLSKCDVTVNIYGRPLLKVKSKKKNKMGSKKDSKNIKFTINEFETKPTKYNVKCYPHTETNATNVIEESIKDEEYIDESNPYDDDDDVETKKITLELDSKSKPSLIEENKNYEGVDEDEEAEEEEEDEAEEEEEEEDEAEEEEEEVEEEAEEEEEEVEEEAEEEEEEEEEEEVEEEEEEEGEEEKDDSKKKVVEEEEEEDEDEEEEEEVFVKTINGREYYVVDNKNSDIYEMLENEEIGEIVGTIKNGISKFI